MCVTMNVTVSVTIKCDSVHNNECSNVYDK